VKARRRPSCSPAHRPWCSPAHAALVGAYRDARDAVLAVRESSTVVPATFAHGANLSAYQLEGADLQAAYPLPLFREWLLAHARPREVADA